VKGAGLVILSSFPAHQIVVGQKLLENSIHLSRRRHVRS
jgi:hypothetical protein